MQIVGLQHGTSEALDLLRSACACSSFSLSYFLSLTTLWLTRSFICSTYLYTLCFSMPRHSSQFFFLLFTLKNEWIVFFFVCCYTIFSCLKSVKMKLSQRKSLYSLTESFGTFLRPFWNIFFLKLGIIY